MIIEISLAKKMQPCRCEYCGKKMFEGEERIKMLAGKKPVMKANYHRECLIKNIREINYLLTIN